MGELFLPQANAEAASNAARVLWWIKQSPFRDKTPEAEQK
jgi:hypothetical protein